MHLKPCFAVKLCWRSNSGILEITRYFSFSLFIARAICEALDNWLWIRHPARPKEVLAYCFGLDFALWFWILRSYWLLWLFQCCIFFQQGQDLSTLSRRQTFHKLPEVIISGVRIAITLQVFDHSTQASGPLLTLSVYRRAVRRESCYTVKS